MSKGRSEAAPGGNSRGRWETGRRVGRGRLKDPLPALSLSVASGILLKYLQEQNRPYSAQDVFGNLQREHGLGKTVRILSSDCGTSPGTSGACTLQAAILAQGFLRLVGRFPSLVTSFRLPKSLS